MHGFQHASYLQIGTQGRACHKCLVSGHRGKLFGMQAEEKHLTMNDVLNILFMKIYIGF